MEDMSYVIERDEEISAPEFDLLSYLGPTEPAADAQDGTTPVYRDIHTHELVQMTQNDVDLVIDIFGPEQENWPEYAVYDAAQEHFSRVLAMAKEMGFIEA